MRRIAITGGIGSGKTAATTFLESLGYSVIDADEALSLVTGQGSQTLGILRDAFGSAVVNHDGTYNRKFVADVVFSDSAALRRLNAITHKAITEQMHRDLARATGELVFLSIPLLGAHHRAVFNLDEAWAVVAPPELAIERLVQHRDMTEADARARIAVQMSNEERVGLCDVVIENFGSLEALHYKLASLCRERESNG
jgi:dephospho-CoA kinase